MMKRYFVAALLGASSIAAAQHDQPYAGQQAREIKALSRDEIEGYLAGAGMGYARPAELNGYPGPMHVLQLAEQIKLTAQQKVAMRHLMEDHKAQARSLGARFVQSERELEVLFRAGNVDQATLAASVEQASMLQGLYRLSHLETHRKALALLTPDQVSAYNRARGYSSGELEHQHK